MATWPSEIQNGSVLRCIARVDVFATPTSWEGVGEIKEGDFVVAADAPVDVDGSPMIAIMPEGAVELANFELAEPWEMPQDGLAPVPEEDEADPWQDQETEYGGSPYQQAFSPKQDRKGQNESTYDYLRRMQQQLHGRQKLRQRRWEAEQAQPRQPKTPKTPPSELASFGSFGRSRMASPSSMSSPPSLRAPRSPAKSDISTAADTPLQFSAIPISPDRSELNAEPLRQREDYRAWMEYRQLKAQEEEAGGGKRPRPHSQTQPFGRMAMSELSATPHWSARVEAAAGRSQATASRPRPGSAPAFRRPGSPRSGTGSGYRPKQQRHVRLNGSPPGSPGRSRASSKSKPWRGAGSMPIASARAEQFQFHHLMNPHAPGQIPNVVFGGQIVSGTVGCRGREVWTYEPQDGAPLAVRAKPKIDGPRTPYTLEPGDIFEVCRALNGPGGALMLKLADGRGWAFDRKEGVGILCTRLSDAADDQPLEEEEIIKPPKPIRRKKKRERGAVELVSELFTLVGAKSGVKSGARLLHQFLQLCGYNGSVSMLTGDFPGLCDSLEKGREIDFYAKDLSRLVTDRNGLVAPCTTDDLHFLLALVGSREELVRQLFLSLADGKDHLSSGHLRQIGKLQGFEPSDTEWFQQLASFESRYNWNGNMALDLKKFSELLNDPEGDAHLTNDELQFLLQELRCRQMLLALIFRKLDSDRSGRLSSEKIRPFVEATGVFNSGGKEWDKFYNEITDRYAWPRALGADPRGFSLWASGRETNASNEELYVALTSVLSQRKSAEKSSESSSLLNQLAGGHDELRPVLIQSIYRYLQALNSISGTSSGRVGMWEIYRLVEILGLNYNRESFPNAYGKMCNKIGLDPKGDVDKEHFKKLLEEEPLGCNVQDLQRLESALEEDIEGAQG